MLKRRALEKHLRAHGCECFKHGGSHDRWVSPAGKRSTVPRHREIGAVVARAICEQLGVEVPENPR
ncbi:MAG: type II toxin-antitoxin system HicA family toxin [Thermoleophilaceae bacterium]|nr:type II toxin-antitoxin system HicA family toxin [Thermoleophilaceae bacterium]